MPRKQSNEKPARKGFGSDKPERKPAGRNTRSRDGFGGDDKKPFARPERRSRDDFKSSDSPRERKSGGGFKADKAERSPRSFDRSEKPERKSRSGFGFEDKPERKQRSFNRDEKSERSPRTFNRDEKPERKSRGGFGSDERERKPRSFNRDDKAERSPRSFDRSEKPERKSRGGFGSDERERKPRTFNRDDKPERSPRSFDRSEKPERKSRGGFGSDERERKPRTFNRDEKPERNSRSSFGDKPERKGRGGFDADKKAYGKKGFKTPYLKPGSKSFNAQKAYERKAALERTDGNAEDKENDGKVRLNRYIANAGICSRREADVLIQSGAVKVNGKVITEMGYKVGPDDVVNYGGESLRRERPVYILMNKPKDFITTTDDPQERKTVMNLVKHGGPERLYPVGRLDRNTTGLLLITNDGDMAKKLTHPSSRIKKVYHVFLDKNLKKADLEQIANGLELEDGFIKVDSVEYVADSADKKQVGIEIHSGRNRIVRRIFESLGYTVVKLDRVMFAGLTKKDLARGRTRYLTELEISTLKMI